MSLITSHHHLGKKVKIHKQNCKEGEFITAQQAMLQFQQLVALEKFIMSAHKGVFRRGKHAEDPAQERLLLCL